MDDGPLCSAPAFDEEEFVICSRSAEVEGQRSHIASSLECDAVFPSMESAKSAITEYASCPVLQTSRKKHEFVSFLCFRAGVHRKRASLVTEDLQRDRKSLKCECPFAVKLRRMGASESYKVYYVNDRHNHEVFDQAELESLPQNRFIPENVKDKILELNQHGVLTPSQIMTLIEKDEFPELKVTWTKRDVQNLIQKHSRRTHEASDFVNLLNERCSAGWETRIFLDSETSRMQRIFWMSAKGKEQYQVFNDVLEVDATYKTNRFGMPLVLFTAIDNHGITHLVAGCLVSNERYESYLWCFRAFAECGANLPPVVVFSDGDTEIARAIAEVWPQSTHLLCRFHIAQNVNRALAGVLRCRLTEFLGDFWRIGSIEELSRYCEQFEELSEKYPEAGDYLKILKSKDKKWAFAYTHEHFVAGVSSTQRQESINSQIKSSLLSNSSLNRILDGLIV
jgi:hypothetical protein